MTCPICRSTDIQNCYPFQGLYIVGCNSCSFQWLNPQPTDDQLNDIYNDSYFFGNENSLILERVYKLKRQTASLYLKQLVKFSGLKGIKIDKLKLLEIGCGTGDFLLEAQANGFEVFGMDVNNNSVQLINQRLKEQRVFAGHIEDAIFPENYFDFIVLFDVIEHVRDPRKFLLSVYKYLNQNGKVFIVAPSLDSWSSKFLGRHWMEYKLEHLSYFGKKSMSTLLTETGYENILFFPNYKILNYDYISMHFDRFPVRNLSKLVKLTRNLMPNFIAQVPIRIVASGLALIANKR